MHILLIRTGGGKWGKDSMTGSVLIKYCILLITTDGR
jgi:hypothetical protein